MRLHKGLHKLLATESAAPLGLHKVFIEPNLAPIESSFGPTFYRLNPKFPCIASQECLHMKRSAVLRAPNTVSRKRILPLGEFPEESPFLAPSRRSDLTARSRETTGRRSRFRVCKLPLTDTAQPVRGRQPVTDATESNDVPGEA